MPSRNQSGKPEHSFQNPNKKRKKSRKKIPKVVKHHKMLLTRMEKEGETKRLAHAMGMVQAKIKKYRISDAMLK